MKLLVKLLWTFCLLNRFLDKRHWTTPIGHHGSTRVRAPIPRITVQASSVANVRSWASSKMMTLYLERLCWRIGLFLHHLTNVTLEIPASGPHPLHDPASSWATGLPGIASSCYHHLFKASGLSYHRYGAGAPAGTTTKLVGDLVGDLPLVNEAFSSKSPFFLGKPLV